MHLSQCTWLTSRKNENVMKNGFKTIGDGKLPVIVLFCQFFLIPSFTVLSRKLEGVCLLQHYRHLLNAKVKNVLFFVTRFDLTSLLNGTDEYQNQQIWQTSLVWRLSNKECSYSVSRFRFKKLGYRDMLMLCEESKVTVQTEVSVSAALTFDCT